MRALSPAELSAVEQALPALGRVLTQEECAGVAPARGGGGMKLEMEGRRARWPGWPVKCRAYRFAP